MAFSRMRIGDCFVNVETADTDMLAKIRTPMIYLRCLLTASYGGEVLYKNQ